MASLGKKILSAFMEVTEKEKERTADAGSGPMGGDPHDVGMTGTGAGSGWKPGLDGGPGAEARSGGTRSGADAGPAAPVDNRYAEYFDKLLGEANIPGPDYYEFARMVAGHWDGIEAYCHKENKVPLGFVEGLNNKIRVIQRRAYRLRDEEYLRLKILTCMLPEL